MSKEMIDALESAEELKKYNRFGESVKLNLTGSMLLVAIVIGMVVAMIGADHSQLFELCK